jgi:hypothetical protein
VPIPASAVEVTDKDAAYEPTTFNNKHIPTKAEAFKIFWIFFMFGFLRISFSRTGEIWRKQSLTVIVDLC